MAQTTIEVLQPVGGSEITRKIQTYAVRQVGAAWHWEVREHGKLVDRGIANSVVSARVAALLVGGKRPQSVEAL